MNFPIAIKPDRGQGSKGFKRIDSYSQAEVQLVDNIAINKLVITEYLPGKEYTVDCFTDSKGQLLFTSSRIRTVIVNGIASKTEIVHDPTLLEMAELINRSLKFCGAWFFQVKIDNKGSYKILEIGCRIAGASGLQRSIGVNLSELWVHLMDGKELMIAKNLLKAHRTVSKENSVVLNHAFDQIFVDFDDCLIFKNEINTNLLNFLKRGKREGIELFLITRHEGNIFEKLEDLGIRSMFSDIYHLVNGGLKSQYFSKNRSILFVDDSFRERLDASKYQNVQSIDPSVFIDYVTLKSENHEGY